MLLSKQGFLIGLVLLGLISLDGFHIFTLAKPQHSQSKEPVPNRGRGEFDIFHTTKSGAKVGCRGDVRKGQQEITEIYVEDTDGKRALGKDDILKMKPDVSRFGRSFAKALSPFRYWPESCIEDIFGKMRLNPFNLFGGLTGLGLDKFPIIGEDIPTIPDVIPGVCDSEDGRCGCTPGPPGEDGDPGAPGAPGPPGTPGANGVAGNPGSAAPNGQPGSPGSKGERGEPGQPGLQGCKGLIGPPGDPGKRGLDGRDGLPGTNAANGKDGKPGTPGKDGTPGINGNPGVQGPQGPAGSPGANGLPGSSGVSGSTGLIGTPGKNGKPGLPGKAGLNGKPGVCCSKKTDVPPSGPSSPSGCGYYTIQELVDENMGLKKDADTVIGAGGGGGGGGGGSDSSGGEGGPAQGLGIAASNSTGIGIYICNSQDIQINIDVENNDVIASGGPRRPPKTTESFRVGLENGKMKLTPVGVHTRNWVLTKGFNP